MSRDSEVDALRLAVLGLGAVRIRYDELWRLWCAAAPRLIGTAPQVDELTAAVRLLAGEGTIELPRGDPRATGSWPSHITVPTARKPVRPKLWQSYPWRAELGWAASLRTLSDELFDDLVSINTWLNRHASDRTPIVPVRYRAAEIFGREKRLDELEKTSLFGPARLRLELLACTRLAPPLPAAMVGTGSDIVVVENSDTYWVFVELLRASTAHPIGAVVWGSGNSFPAQAPALALDVAGRGSVTGIAWYWGDFDPQGVAIAAMAAQQSRSVRVRPPHALWNAMADRPIQDAGSVNWAGVDGEPWLGRETWNRLAPIRSAAGRVAQEAVPTTVVAEWIESRARAGKG